MADSKSENSVSVSDMEGELGVDVYLYLYRDTAFVARINLKQGRGGEG